MAAPEYRRVGEKESVPFSTFQQSKDKPLIFALAKTTEAYHVGGSLFGKLFILAIDNFEPF